jgi:hypothetical protein
VGRALRRSDRRRATEHEEYTKDGTFVPFEAATGK